MIFLFVFFFLFVSDLNAVKKENSEVIKKRTDRSTSEYRERRNKLRAQHEIPDIEKLKEISKERNISKETIVLAYRHAQRSRIVTPGSQWKTPQYREFAEKFKEKYPRAAEVAINKLNKMDSQRASKKVVSPQPMVQMNVKQTGAEIITQKPTIDLLDLTKLPDEEIIINNARRPALEDLFGDENIDINNYLD